MIRLATIFDLENIIEIKKEIVIEMKKLGNPQWHDNYPSKEDFLEDINSSSLYVYDNEEVKGFICIKKDNDDEYESVIESTKKASYIIHRLGVAKKYRHQNIAYSLMKHAEDLAKSNNVYLIKADTEITNLKMNNLFQKLGYKKLSSTLKWSDNAGTFNYYELQLQKD